jgi:hypothetical protein
MTRDYLDATNRMKFDKGKTAIVAKNSGSKFKGALWGP